MVGVGGWYGVFLRVGVLVHVVGWPVFHQVAASLHVAGVHTARRPACQASQQRPSDKKILNFSLKLKRKCPICILQILFGDPKIICGNFTHILYIAFVKFCHRPQENK